MGSAPPFSDLVSSYSAVRSMSLTAPRPSQRGHMPPVMLKLRRSLVVVPPRWRVTAPAPEIDATLNENAWGEPMCGWPSRLNRMRSIALASVAVPTVDRGSEPIRCWSTRIAVVSPSRTSTSGRASVGMKPCTKELYVSLISRCDSAAIVPKTSELLPDPETPVNTVSRRFGIWRLTSLRLFTRAPCTRIQSWLSATCDAGGCSSVFVAMLMGSPSPGRDAGAVSVGARCATCPAPHRPNIPERSPSRPRTGVTRAGRGSTPCAWGRRSGWGDPDEVARGVTEGAVTRPPRLRRRLLQHLGAGRPDLLERGVEVVGGEDRGLQRPLGHQRQEGIALGL